MSPSPLSFLLVFFIPLLSNSKNTLVPYFANGQQGTTPTTTNVAPPFSYTIESTSASVAQFSVTVPKGTYVGIGTASSTNTYASWAAICEPTVSAGCASFVCTSTSACASGVTLTGRSTVSNTMTFSRPYTTTTPGDTPGLVLGNNNLVWINPATSAGFVPGSANVANQAWTSFVALIMPFTGTEPTFEFSMIQPSATLVSMSFVTNPGSYAALGLQTGSNAFPSFVAVCEPASLPACGIYACTSATACSVDATPGLTQVVTASNSSAVITFPLTSALVPNKPLNTLWYEQNIPTAGLTLSTSLVISQTWKQFVTFIFPPPVAPSFAYNFTATNNTYMTISITPSAGQLALLGWTTDGLNYPNAAVLCASTVAKCLDVSCTSQIICAANDPSILTANAVVSGVATLTRLFSDASFPIIPNTTMALTWATVPFTGTTITSSLAQSVTWNYYSASAPNCVSFHSLRGSVFLCMMTFFSIVFTSIFLL